MWNILLISILFSFVGILLLILFFFTSFTNDKSIWLGKRRSGSWMSSNYFWRSKFALTLIILEFIFLVFLILRLIGPSYIGSLENNTPMIIVIAIPLGLALSLLLLSPLFVILNLLCIRWLVKEKGGYTRVISLRKFIEPYDNRGDFDKLRSKIEKVFKRQNIELEFLRNVGFKTYTHGVIFLIRKYNMILEIEKIAHVSSPNFRFILTPNNKNEKMDPKKVIRILNKFIFQDGDIELRVWKKMIKASKKKK